VFSEGKPGQDERLRSAPTFSWRVPSFGFEEQTMVRAEDQDVTVLLKLIYNGEERPRSRLSPKKCPQDRQVNRGVANWTLLQEQLSAPAREVYYVVLPRRTLWLKRKSKKRNHSKCEWQNSKTSSQKST
jgi:hypothetical protein